MKTIKTLLILIVLTTLFLIGCETTNNSNTIVNINTATKSELMTLNGIADVKAQEIIDYRTKNGPFEKIEDIMKVKGIGKATFEDIKIRIVVEDTVIEPDAVVVE